MTQSWQTRWPEGAEARIYLRLTAWYQFTPKTLGGHLGMTQQSAARLLQGGPVGDKTVARALLLRPELKFEALFQLKSDHDVSTKVAVMHYPEHYAEAEAMGLELVASGIRNVDEPIIPIKVGDTAVMGYAPDDSLFLFPDGRGDPSVLAIIKKRFDLDPDDIYKTPGVAVITDENALRMREAAAKKRESEQ